MSAEPRRESASASLTLRLTLLYVLSASLILLVCTVLLYLAFTRNLRRRDLEFLSDEVSELRSFMLQRPEGLPPGEGTAWKTSGSAMGRHYIRIMDADGALLVESDGMASLLPREIFPAIETGAAPAQATLEWTSREGKPYVLLSELTRGARRSSRPGLVQAALEISHERALLRDYRRKMGFTLLFGILASAGAGAWVARRGLRPLAEITETAQRITQATLHERIRGARWPKELEKLARVFDGMLERLEESFERLSQFSADLAHELRTPINNLMGEAEVALSRARTPEEYRQVIESSLEECGRLGRMIESLLFIARAEGDGAAPAPRPLDGRAEIEAVRDFFDAVGEEGGIEMTCRGAAPVHADPLLFRRALSNLVSNALRHTPRGGRVEMSVESRGNGARVTVADTGTGIPPEHLPRIFDRFYRSESDRARYPEGTGLGLAIVKSIMSLHGGTIGVESRPGSGTVVTLDFPPPT